MDKLILILLVTFATVSLGHWWVAATFIDRYGLLYPLMVAVFQVTILCVFLQAERALVNETSGHSTPWLQSRWFNSPLQLLFLIGCFIVSAMLAAHHLMVLGWQMNIFFEIMSNNYQLQDFSLLLSQQSRLLGNFWQQLFWLLVAMTFFILCVYGIYGRFRRVIAPMLLLFGFCAFMLFLMFFFWQHDIQFESVLSNKAFDWYVLLESALTMAVESSLVGFGVFFALKFVAKLNIEQSFLLFAIVLSAILSALLAFGSWVLTEHIGSASFPFSVDTLILMTPLYLTSLPAEGITLSLWIIFSLTLACIKVALLSGVCLYLFSRYLFHGFEENKLLAPALICLIAFSGLIISTITTSNYYFDISIFFRDIFITFFYYWLPIQLSLLCLVVFFLPNLAHGNLIAFDYNWLAASARWCYLLFAIATLLFFIYRVHADAGQIL